MLSGAYMYDEEEAVKYQLDIKHPLYDSEETFEVYECPNCHGRFLVESEALESIEEMFCPYCKTVFKEKNAQAYELLALSRMTGEQIADELNEEERDKYYKLMHGE